MTTTESIFITGATGCIGHYIVNKLLKESAFHCHLYVRSPEKLKVNYKNHPRVTLHIGDLEQVEEVKDVVSKMNYIIHIATDWCNSDYATLLNKEKTHLLFNYTDPKVLKRIVYFSTASILNPDHQPIPEAGDYGSGYVRSKYLAYTTLKEVSCYDKIVTVFPTLVFGGDSRHPYSHISEGLMPNLSFLKWLKYIYVDGSFHYLHANDIAKVAIYLLTAESVKSDYVLGTAQITAKQAIATLCRVFNRSQFFCIKIPRLVIFALAKLFRITIGPWEKYCIQNSHMTYKTVNPATFGLKTEFPTLQSVLEDIKSQND